MVKLVTMWTRPADEAGFNSHYAEVHRPLAEALGAESLELLHFAKGDVFRMALITFPDSDALRSRMRSEEGAALAADARWLEENFGVVATSSVATADS